MDGNNSALLGGPIETWHASWPLCHLVMLRWIENIDTSFRCRYRAISNRPPQYRFVRYIIAPSFCSSSSIFIARPHCDLAMQSAVLARGILSVCPSVRHDPVLCPDE